jgi:hypothetical protein
MRKFWQKKQHKREKNPTEKHFISFTDLFLDGMERQGEGLTKYDKDGMTLFHHIALTGNIDVIQTILRRGVDPNIPARAKGFLGYSPLHFAALKGHVQIIEALIAGGANINQQCNGFNTPLHLAAYVGKAAAVCALLAYGADPTLRDDVGKTPLDYALEQGHEELRTLLSGTGKPADTRIARLGYSLCAMLDEAKRNGLYEDDDNIPIIPEVLPIFSKASNHFMCIIQSQDPRFQETLMHHSCRYLWGKSIEAAFLWAKSPDGNISINFEAGEMAKQTITTELPEQLERIVISSIDDFVPYFKAHQNAMIANQSMMTPDSMIREIAVTLEYFPQIGLAYAIAKGYHETVW